LVRLNWAGVRFPDEAVTVYPPGVVLAVAVTLAAPEAFVVTTPLDENVALAPLAGAANVTVAPETGLEKESTTLTCNGCGKAVLTEVLWVPPPVTLIVAAAPAVFVRLN
jgi:hypothetical protein